MWIDIRWKGIEDVPKQKEDFWNTINGNKVNINLLTDDDVKIVEDGSIRLIVIHVPRADFNMRPVYVGENPYKGTYKRNHEGDYHATEHEIREMIRDQNPEGNDNQIIEYYTMDDIDKETLRKITGKQFSEKVNVLLPRNSNSLLIHEYPNVTRTFLMSKKVMLNQNEHYQSQIIPFNYALNISLDELVNEINEIKERFNMKAEN